MLLNHTDHFEKLMVNMLHRKIRLNEDFGVLKAMTSRFQTRNIENRQKYEDVQLQALSDEDDSQTQKQLDEQSGVRQQTVFNRLREMGKIQKSGRWVPHELNDRQIEKRKNTRAILLARHKRKSFLHHLTIR